MVWGMSPEPLAVPICTAAGAALVLSALVGLGSSFSRWLNRATGPLGVFDLPFCLTAGWSMAAIASACLAPFGLHQTILSQGLLAVGLLRLVAFRRDLLRPLLLALALGFPLAVMTASMPAVMFDEFTHWLPNTRFLVDHDAYWLAGEWAGGSGKPGYPNGTTVISLLVTQIVGPASAETAFKTFMAFGILTFGWLLAGAWRGSKVSLPVVALFALIALVDPFFDPRIALSSYADAPSGLVLAVAGLAAVNGIVAMNRGDKAAARAWLVWSGFACATLVMLRTTNLILVGALIAATVRCLPRRWGESLQAVLSMAALPGLGLAVWRVYLHAAGIGPDMASRPLVQWDWSAPAVVLRVLFIDRLLNNPVMALAAGLVVLLAGFGLLLCRGRWTSASPGIDLRTLFRVQAIVCGGFCLFLAWAYIAVFSPAEVGQAASAWRYLSELGPFLTLALVVVLPRQSFRIGRWAPVLGGGIMVVILLAPFWGRGYYGVACRYADVLAARTVARDLGDALTGYAPTGERQRRVALVHPDMADWFANLAAYQLVWPSVEQPSFALRMGESSSAATEQWAWETGVEVLLDMTKLDRPALVSSKMIPAIALRARPEEHGQPWPIIAVVAAQPLPPPCGRPEQP